MKALSIDPAGGTRELDVSDDHDGGFAADLRAVIGCDAIEAFDLAPGFVAWVDENGISAGQPVNERATQLARSLGAPTALRGTVILSGFNSDNGLSVGLKDRQLMTIRHRMIGTR